MNSDNFHPCYERSCALIVGINKYLHVNPLARACSDARSVAATLASDLGFPKEDMTVLLDEQATRAEIMRAFMAFESLSPDDRVFVFFAGHGVTVPGRSGDVGYLAPVDGNIADRSTLIPWYDLTRGSEIIPAKHILFVMDACYSGLAIQRGSKAGGRRFISNMLQRFSRQVITAGKADETVADGGSDTGQNSIFTGHLLDGLRGNAANDKGVLTGTLLMHYVYEKVATDPKSRQTPHYGHLLGDGDIVLRTTGNTHLSASLGDSLVEPLPERPEQPIATTLSEIKPVFAESNGYADPGNGEFGRNEWSAKLGTVQWTADGTRELVSATHWLAVVIEPVSNQPVEFELMKLASAVGNHAFHSEKPYDRFPMPRETITTAKSAVLYDAEYSGNQQGDAPWKRFVRIQRTGAIEYCDFSTVASTYLLGNNQQNPGTPTKVFYYVQVIGAVWSFLFAAKRLLKLTNYEAGIRCLINLVGARDSWLVEFSHQDGPENKHWVEPFSANPMLRGSRDWRCRDLNLQSDFQMVIGSLGELESQKILKEYAEDLGLAFNHQSAPRCFVCGTDTFPWNQYDYHLYQR